MTFIVHHLNNSRSQRVLWLLEELGADYEIVPYQRDAQTNLAPVELQQAHPLGKSPVIEENGRVVAESGAIIEYLCACHGGQDWLPDRDSTEWIDPLEWMQFAESSFFVPVMLKIYSDGLGKGAAPLLPRINEQLGKHISFAERGISDELHFVGSYWSAADVMVGFPAEIAIVEGMARKRLSLRASLRRFTLVPPGNVPANAVDPISYGKTLTAAHDWNSPIDEN